MIQSVFDFFEAHSAIAAVAFGLSVITMIGSAVFIPYWVTHIPADYFVHNQRRSGEFKSVHSLYRMCLLAVKNLLGLVLLAAGSIMLITPGQGVLTMLAGLALIDVPGKRRLERWIIARPLVLKTMNRLRMRAGQPPLEVSRK